MKAFKLVGVVVLCGLGLAGCANGGSNRQAALNAALHEFGACNEAIIDRPEYAALRRHTFRDEIPASELADEELPTPEEARLLVARWDARAPCRHAFVAALESPPINRPDAASLWGASYAQTAANIARFAKGHMTWAEMARRAQALQTALVARGTAADAAVAAEARQEAHERALDTAALLGAMQPQRTQIEPFSCSGDANYFSCH